MKPQTLSIAIALALSAPAWSQQAQPSNATLPLHYVGGDGQVGLSVDQEGDISGGATWFFGDNGRSNWHAQGWLGQGGAGGLQFGRHWFWNGMSLDDAIANPSKVTVAKGFLAVDQNAFDDRKLSLGMGLEREHWFFDAYISQGLTDERLVGTRTDSSNRFLTGTLNGRPIRQLQTTTTTTDTFEKAYEDGVGVRLGRWFDQHLLRLRGGFDYEDGEFGANQETISFNVEKYFRNTPHSLTLDLEFLNKAGRFEVERNDSRGMVGYRYEFGRPNFRVAEPVREVEVKREVAELVPGDTVVVKNEVRIDNESFFEIDSARITSAAQNALDGVIAAIQSERRVSRVSVIGHTCDLGPATYNQNLSERRASAVKAFFAARGIELTEMDASGKGESEPKYPNTREQRGKNRRVDVSFLTLEEKSELGAPKEVKKEVVEWVKEPIKVPAPWIERAMRNPSQHKRSVDVYRFEKANIDITTGPVEFLNRSPSAVNDTVSVPRNAAGFPLNVLANDTDPDNDPLSITSVTAPQHGSASISGSSILYTPSVGYLGPDTFTYSISDGKGGTSTATVNITVNNATPVAVDDSASGFKNQALSVNVIANDRDPDGEALTLVGVSGAQNGTASVVNGQVQYTPNPGFAGTEILTYTIRDASGATTTGRLTITINNRAPIAVNDIGVAASFQEINVLVNDSDPDGDVIRVVSVSTPANGSVTILPDGRVRYIPNLGWCGVDTFTYTIEDSSGARATATVTAETLD